MNIISSANCDGVRNPITCGDKMIGLLCGELGTCALELGNATEKMEQN